jgi:hypothetical protein
MDGGCVQGWTVVAYYPPKVVYLRDLLNISDNQANWLAANTGMADEIYQALQDNLNLDPIDDNVFPTNPTPEAMIAAQLSITPAMNDFVYGPYDEQHYNLIKPYLPNQPTYDPIIWELFKLQCAIIKLEHPEWGSIRVYFEAAREYLHTTLDVAGMIPLVGEIADLANGFLYTLAGDGVNATLSLAAAIPGAGWASTTVKYAKKTLTLSSGAKSTLRWLKRNDNIIEFGDRGQLRTVLGLVKGDPRLAHHIIPWILRDHNVIQKAANHKQAFHMNELFNGIPLEHAAHSGGHSIYIQKVTQRLDIFDQFRPIATYQEAQIFVEQLIGDIRTAIQNNPNTHLNFLSF